LEESPQAPQETFLFNPDISFFKKKQQHLQANIIQETKTVDYIDNGEEQQSNKSDDI
jgi:hypothetical protein